ncbi:hypothetical protein CAEBREN_30021 [Caenorhabditis brenneri]|uniref:Uncharacterized protein n=1 Tax=Caenorhabditis brenneri TaxID=135651 RepID=G0MCE1_CAEBE|nr:hypothetical protein CAEBREN_30021 [Caenorhabditis brenneri]
MRADIRGKNNNRICHLTKSFSILEGRKQYNSITGSSMRWKIDILLEAAGNYQKFMMTCQICRSTVNETANISTRHQSKKYNKWSNTGFYDVDARSQVKSQDEPVIKKNNHWKYDGSNAELKLQNVRITPPSISSQYEENETAHQQCAIRLMKEKKRKETTHEEDTAMEWKKVQYMPQQSYQPDQSSLLMFSQSQLRPCCAIYITGSSTNSCQRKKNRLKNPVKKKRPTNEKNQRTSTSEKEKKGNLCLQRVFNVQSMQYFTMAYYPMVISMVITMPILNGYVLCGYNGRFRVNFNQCTYISINGYLQIIQWLVNYAVTILYNGTKFLD